tara:strand:- start:64 stop:681 length:618 start_codon:yes stop_codon:yes gene_type:complete
MTLDLNFPKGPIQNIKGQCISLIGDDIDTDRIIPARFLKCVDFDSLGASVFADDRKHINGIHPFDSKDNKDASILIVNSNFGCGSSREHAPQALMRWGIRAIIGESFADIFYSNCIAIGIPCFTLKKQMIKDLQSKSQKNNLFFDISIKKSLAMNDEFSVLLNFKESSKQLFLNGEWDATTTLLNNLNLIKEKIKHLPYLSFIRK